MSLLADLELHENRGQDVLAKNWKTTSRSGEDRLRGVRISFMRPWSGHIWSAPVTSGKRGICKLQLDHDAEGHLESKSPEELLKAGMEREAGT